MGETSKKFWTAIVLLLGMTGFALSVLGAEDQTVGGFAAVATVLGVVVALRSKFDRRRQTFRGVAHRAVRCARQVVGQNDKLCLARWH